MYLRPYFPYSDCTSSIYVITITSVCVSAKYIYNISCILNTKLVSLNWCRELSNGNIFLWWELFYVCVSDYIRIEEYFLSVSVDIFLGLEKHGCSCEQLYTTVNDDTHEIIFLGSCLRWKFPGIFSGAHEYKIWVSS